jgi:hypothetical protein
MKRIALAASALAALGVGLIFAPSSARAFTMTFDEFGNCSSNVGTCSGTVVSTDPSLNPLTSGPVLVFSLPTLTFSGNVNVLAQAGQ